MIGPLHTKCKRFISDIYIFTSISLQRRASNEYPQHSLLGEVKTNIYLNIPLIYTHYYFSNLMQCDPVVPGQSHETLSDTSDQVTKAMMFLLCTYKNKQQLVFD